MDVEVLQAEQVRLELRAAAATGDAVEDDGAPAAGEVEREGKRAVAARGLQDDVGPCARGHLPDARRGIVAHREQVGRAHAPRQRLVGAVHADHDDLLRPRDGRPAHGEEAERPGPYHRDRAVGSDRRALGAVDDAGERLGHRR